MRMAWEPAAGEAFLPQVTAAGAPRPGLSPARAFPGSAVAQRSVLCFRTRQGFPTAAPTEREPPPAWSRPAPPGSQRAPGWENTAAPAHLRPGWFCSLAKVTEGSGEEEAGGWPTFSKTPGD